MKNYYSILNINNNASEKDIKKAYRVLAIKYHPDKNHGDKALTEKFLEVKEAYDILINPISRQDYDNRYSDMFENINTNQTSTSFNESNNKSTVEDDYTPQYEPSFDLFGTQTKFKKFSFFKLPKNIGIIIGAYSDLKKEDKPLTQQEKKSNLLKGLGVSLIIYLLIYFIGSPNSTWSIIWFIVTFGGIGLIVYGINTFFHKNLFVGTNGFANFEVTDNVDNISKDIEVNFRDITDIYVHFTERVKNFEYQRTDYEYVILNNGEEVYSEKDSFNKKDKIKSQPIELNFCRKIESAWSIYLLNTMEEKLQKDGYLTFNLYSYGKVKKYIKMGIGEITFIRDNEEFTYNYDDIKKVYTKGNDLFIEHSNFQRKFYFIKSGEADKIPLLDLCNRNFFFKAFEILLGYSI